MDIRSSAAAYPRLDPFGAWYCEPHQDALWKYLEAGGLRACCVWHRRAGKDDVALRWARRAACKRVGNYWHMLPQAEQARKAIWSAINPHTGVKRIDEAFPLALRRRTRENEMLIELKNGSTWQVVGSDNYNALVGSPPVGIVFSEWALADPASWAYLRPILRENGGWAVFIYTPRGRNHGLALYQSAQQAAGWFHERLRAEQTEVFTAAELEVELEELTAEYGEEMGRAFFEQEYCVSFDAANIGAVYARQLNRLEALGRVCPLGHDADFPVHTFWDFGFGDSTVVWFVQILPGPRIHVIDHLKASGLEIKDYASRVLGREVILTPGTKAHFRLGDPLAKHEHRQAYRYGEHYVPHDGANKNLAAGGRSIGDQFHDLGIEMQIVPATSVANSIAAARKTLTECYFDMVRCEKGLEALHSYHYPWDEKLRKLGDVPVHDWSSHDADAFEVLGQVWQPLRADQPKEKPRFLHEATADEVFWPQHSGVEKWKRDRI